MDELQAGTRGVDGEEEKRNPADFALWKKASHTHIMRWLFRSSIGFPGWHLECSAMSTKYLGESFDIHGGGMDLKFPHHECEIAQNSACSGHKGARYWMHANMLTLNGKRMSKSTVTREPRARRAAGLRKSGTVTPWSRREPSVLRRCGSGWSRS